MLRIDLDTLIPAPASDAATTLLTAPSPVGAPTDPVPVSAASTRQLVRTDAPPVLALGAAGGAGTTTTVLGLAAAISAHCADLDIDADPVCVDASPFGGDLAARGCDAQTAIGSVQAWLSTPRPGLPSAVTACTGATSAGARILPRTPDPLPGRESFVSVHRHLTDSGAVPIYDGGGAVANRDIAPLLSDPRIALALVTAARPDAVNRLSPALTWLYDRYGAFVLSRAVIVVAEQIPGTGAPVTDHLRTWLGSWVRAVDLIPYDSHLAAGRLVTWTQLSGATRTAYRILLGDLQ